jgi:hypothetical protein
MDILFGVFAGAAALAAIAIWAPRPTRVRVSALVITMAFIPVAYLMFIEMLSKPKPMSFEWYQRATKKAVLLGVSLHEKESIYLWLRPVGSIEPRYYVVPWNLKLAEKLQKAVDTASRGNSTIVLEDPFSRRSLEEWGNLNVEILVPPTPPMKPPPTAPPRIFNPREERI